MIKYTFLFLWPLLLLLLLLFVKEKKNKCLYIFFFYWITNRYFYELTSNEIIIVAIIIHEKLSLLQNNSAQKYSWIKFSVYLVKILLKKWLLNRLLRFIQLDFDKLKELTSVTRYFVIVKFKEFIDHKFVYLLIVYWIMDDKKSSLLIFMFDPLERVL